MLDSILNTNNLKKVIQNKSFRSVIRKPLNDLSIDFLEELALRLIKVSK